MRPPTKIVQHHGTGSAWGQPRPARSDFWQPHDGSASKADVACSLGITPITFRYVKSVCHSWLGAVVLSLNASAALMTMKAGLAIRSGSFPVAFCCHDGIGTPDYICIS